MTDVQLGDRVRDRVSGLTGIAVARTEWLYGCRRVTIQPEEAKDGKPAETYTTDEQSCEVVSAGAIENVQVEGPVRAPARPAVLPAAGPRPDVARRRDPAGRP